ncbi:MAG: hypothetical protein ACF8Q5_10835, partial [Phycisphaerales bacterium JB040]
MQLASLGSNAGIDFGATGLRGAVSVRVAREALDQAQAQGASAVALIDQAGEAAQAARASVGRGPVAPVAGVGETGQTLDLVAGP